MTQIQSSQHDQVRQMAALLLRKKINTHWVKLDKNMQDLVKKALLERELVESSRLVRRSLATVIASVAKHQLPGGEWPELLAFINQLTQSSGEEHRELAMTLFFCLTETVGEHLEPHFGQIKGLFLTALQDPQSPRVRTEAMKAVCSL